MKTERGAPGPWGAHCTDGKYHFSLYAEGASHVRLCLCARASKRVQKLGMYATGNAWHLTVDEDLSQYMYFFDVERAGMSSYVADPYAKDFGLLDRWRHYKPWPAPAAGLGIREFDWDNDRHPRIGLNDTVIYEVHVKGLTKLHPEIPEAIRGTYAALGHEVMIGYLKDLGVTAIELLPVFSKTEDPFLARKGLTNYWGYNTLNYFSPESEYAATNSVQDFKTMVRDLHRAGIEVILDVVYNHTGEGGRHEHTVCYRGIAERAYYRTDYQGNYIDYTHCGNTLNTDSEIARNLVLDSLRYWVSEMHVDGFRFDLAPTIFRHGETVTFEHELHRQMMNDPVLKDVKLIVEPWDLGPDGYQRGRFPAPYLEWNDHFRDAARAFWKGEHNAEGLAALMTHRGKPVINFVTCHDGFTLRDLVSYENKHNEANGEDNRDGSNHSLSFNCGVEGDTEKPEIISLRQKLRKNFFATLIFSQDVPMLLAGDEIGHTQHGNNNAYCQDNAISWIDWSDRDEELRGFLKKCLALRKTLLAVTHPHVVVSQNLPQQAFGIQFDNYILLLNAATTGALFPLPGLALREILHSARPCYAEAIQDVALVPAQCVVLLERVQK